MVEAGRPGIAAVEQEPAALAARTGPGKIYDVHDDQDAFPLRR